MGLLLGAAAMTSMVAACGGGGSASGPTPAPAPTPTATPTPTALCNSAKTLCWPTASPSAVSTAPAKPKIIFLVMLDDADYNDFGYFSTDAVTPNIDSIANSGVRLSRYYAGAPVCSPSRAAILTGQSPIRYGINHLVPNKPEQVVGDYYLGQRGLPDEDSTIADGLRAQGYSTMFVGKWHLGTGQAKFLPGGKGFDRFTVYTGDYPSTRMVTEKGRFAPTTEWLTKYAADEIIDYLDQQLAAGKNVFVNWDPPEPHAITTPAGAAWYVPATFDQAAFDRDAGGKKIDLATDRGKALSMIYSMDAQLGRVLAYIKQKNLYDDSLIIVTSDNGGVLRVASPTRELYEGKGTMFEGGLRVPFAASWPKRFAAGTHTPTVFSAFDIYPTLMGLIGAPVPTGLEGQDLSSVLLTGTGTHKPLYYQFRRVEWRNREDETIEETAALIDGCDKYVLWYLGERLYDVCKDPNERTQLAGSNPAKLASMRAAMRAHRLAVSRFTAVNSVAAASLLKASERLNTAYDDISVYASVNLGTSATGTYNVYRHGDGINLRIANGRLLADITGVADTTPRPALKTVSLDAPIPVDGRSHRFGLVIRGYQFGGSTLMLFVDGVLKAKVTAALGVTGDPGPSVLSVKAENPDVDLGANGVSLSDVLILTNAMEPDQL
jgi:arylsulfatase A-like enzyme